MQYKCSYCDDTSLNINSMFSDNLCIKCSKHESICDHCKVASALKDWKDYCCPNCGELEGSDHPIPEELAVPSGEEQIHYEHKRPVLISILRVTSTILIIASLLMSALVLSGNFEIADPFDKVFGISVLISSFIMFLVLEGIATILEQIYEARQDSRE